MIYGRCEAFTCANIHIVRRPHVYPVSHNCIDVVSSGSINVFAPICVFVCNV